MKLKLSIFALLALLMAGCADDINLTEPDMNEVRMVTISANMSQETRVSYTDSPYGQNPTVAWEADDQLMLVGFDDNNVYKGKSIFTKSGTGNTFSGYTVADATKYKAYYPAEAVPLDGNSNVILNDQGNVSLPDYKSWEQTQDGNNSTSHINKHLYMSDEEGRAITADFQMVAKSTIIKFVLSDIPNDIGAITKLIWQVQRAETLEKSVVLKLTNVSSGTTELTAFLAFDPTEISIAENGVVKVTLCGGKLYEWRTTLTNGKTYTAGKRYTGTASSWTAKLLINPLSYVTEYNVNPAGTGFVNTLHPQKEVNGFFSFDNAVTNFSSIMIGGQPYHLPSELEWKSIVPRDGKFVNFANEASFDNVEEDDVEVQGQKIRCYSDFRAGVDNTFAYALRYKGTDMVSAWKYKEINPEDTINAHMIVTSRNVYGQDITVDDIQIDEFWSNDDANDVVRYFHASGVKVGASYYSSSYGLFWSKTEANNNEGWIMRFSNEHHKAERGSESKDNLYSVRLFFTGGN